MRAFLWVGILCVGFVAGGATCARRDPGFIFPPPPPTLSDSPDLAEVAEALNRTDAVRQLATNSASVKVLSAPSLPSLSATVQLERDRKFRLRASLPIVMGQGLDVGSNDELFWFEAPEGIRRKLYYARHDEYREQLHRAVLPVDPTWLIEAIGLVHLDPDTVTSGPERRADGKLEIRSTMAMPHGDYQKVLHVQHPGGYVTHQFLYAPDGRMVAASEATNHRFDETHQCALPHRIRFDLIPSQGPPMSMQIDVGAYLVNQLLSDDPSVFTMPRDAADAEDLTRLTAAPGIAAMTDTVSPPEYRTAQSPTAPNGFTQDGTARYREADSTALPLRGRETDRRETHRRETDRRERPVGR